MGMLFCVLLASCSSTGDSDIQLAIPSFADSGAPGAAATGSGALAVAATGAEQSTTTSVANQAGAAAMTASIEDAPALPQQVAALPVENPASAKPAVAAAEPETKPEEPAAVAPTVAKSSEAKTAAVDAEQPSPSGQILENGGPYLTAGTMPDKPAPKKKTFLSSLFGSTPANSATNPEASKPSKAVKPLVTLASASPASKPEKVERPVQVASLGGNDLPGVRQTALFEIKRRSGLDDESDVDLHEDEEQPMMQLASAAGMARLAPNGLLKQRESVDVACLKPSLVRVLKTVEQHYGKKMIVTSGYRSPTYNRQVRGAKKSMHMYCAAADVQIAGVSKWELAEYVRSMPGRGGVGTYCHTESVHIDVGPERDWNWRCRRRK